MNLILLKSKIHAATITESNLNYEGSLTLDDALMEAANLLAGERVQILNLNNGSRLETYVIKGKRGSGTVCLNGPAARNGLVGDKIHILSYAVYTQGEAAEHSSKVVHVDDDNRIRA
jgi:aspartate 1-decarboxylase